MGQILNILYIGVGIIFIIYGFTKTKKVISAQLISS